MWELMGNSSKERCLPYRESLLTESPSEGEILNMK